MYCFHLQLNQHLTAFLQRHKHKEKKELPVWEHIERLCSHVRPKRPWPMNETTAVPIRLWTKTRIRTNTHTNTTQLLALHCHPNNPVAGTVLLPTQTMIVLIYMRSIKQPIMPIRLQSTDRTIVLIRLWSNDQLIDQAPNIQPTITTWCWHCTTIKTDTLLFCLQLTN